MAWKWQPHLEERSPKGVSSHSNQKHSQGSYTSTSAAGSAGAHVAAHISSTRVSLVKPAGGSAPGQSAAEPIAHVMPWPQ